MDLYSHAQVIKFYLLQFEGGVQLDGSGREWYQPKGITLANRHTDRPSIESFHLPGV